MGDLLGDSLDVLTRGRVERKVAEGCYSLGACQGEVGVCKCPSLTTYSNKRFVVPGQALSGKAGRRKLDRLDSSPRSAKASCVSLGMSLNISVYRFPHLKNWFTYLLGLFED